MTKDLAEMMKAYENKSAFMDSPINYTCLKLSLLINTVICSRPGKILICHISKCYISTLPRHRTQNAPVRVQEKEKK